TGQTPSHNYAAPGSYKVTLTINNPSLGLVSSTQTVNVIDVSTTVIQNLVCNGDTNGSANVSVAGPPNTYYYAWNTNPIQTTPTAINLPAGNYVVTISATNTCLTQAPITLTQPSAYQKTVATINPICTTKGSIAITQTGNTPNYSFSWQPNVSNTSQANNLDAGDYVIAIKDANNCPDTARATLVYKPNALTVNLGKDTAVCPGEIVVLNPGTYPIYTWQDQSHNPTFNALATGNYYVTVADKNGCTATDSVFVTVNCDDVFFPTAFTPDGNGRNDYFGPLGNLAIVTDYTFQVFNRYGEIVFATNDAYKKWNGKANGNLQTGVFVWYANYSIRTRKNLFQKGTVLIVK
ncbi:MAG: gliding motility-associated C-terminal domain-containing protein, partial [Pedobacter sp.]|nr:gliding motility-associated C-terminal domain-containing protein [Chitinophagaceae bacterium]